MGMVPDPRDHHGAPGNRGIGYRPGRHSRNCDGFRLADRGEWRNGGLPCVSDAEVEWYFSSPRGRDSRSVNRATRCHPSRGWCFGLDVALCLVLYCDWYVSAGCRHQTEVSVMGLGGLCWDGYASAWD